MAESSKPVPQTVVADSVSSLHSTSYTRWYCEENIHNLLTQLVREQLHHHSNLWAVFISNPRKQIPLWNQTSGDAASLGFICYDYHVIALETFKEQEALVYDFDRYFRVINSGGFLAGFASNRSHMKWPDGSWRASPPPQPCIIASDGVAMNLNEYISMESSQQETSAAQYGQVLDEEGFSSFCLPHR